LFQIIRISSLAELVPDESNEVILSGRGVFGALDYICAARTSDSSHYVMYNPQRPAFYHQCKKLSGKYMRMHWYKSQNRNRITNRSSRAARTLWNYPPLSEEDWVLVFDDNALKLPVPGSYWKLKNQITYYGSLFFAIAILIFLLLSFICSKNLAAFRNASLTVEERVNEFD
jgi:hypothetical protein